MGIMAAGEKIVMVVRRSVESMVGPYNMILTCNHLLVIDSERAQVKPN